MINKKILITGIEGFIGKNFFQALKNRCPTAEVYGIDKSFKGKRDFTAIACDIADLEQTNQIISEVRPDYIFHFAGVTYSNNWDELFEGNVKTTISLLSSVKEVGISPRIVIIGSAAEYGYVSPDSLPIKEDTILNPLSPYGVSMCCRTLVSKVYANSGFDVVVGRVFNVLGAGLSEHSPIGSFAKQIAEAERGIREPVVYTGRLDVKRDFLDIVDASDALYLLALYGKSREIYNICSGKSFSIREVLSLLLKNTWLSFRIETVSSRIREKDVPEVYGSYQKIKDDTGWQPTIPIEESLKKTLNYYRREVMV